MKQYIKPSMITLSAGGGGTGTSCNISDEDRMRIEEIIGVPLNQALGMDESCTVPLEQYCKYTSVDTGAIKIVSS